MAWSSAQFEKHLQSGELKPIYLIAGEEPLLLLEAADAVRAQAKRRGYEQREVFDAGTGFDWNDITRASVSMGLFSRKRIFDIRVPTGKPGTAGAEALSSLAQRPDPDTIVLITCMAWSKAHEAKWVAAIDQTGAYLPIWPLKPNELPAWVKERARKCKLRLNEDAVQLLVARNEGNLLAASQELAKLVLLSGADETIDAKKLEDLIPDNARFDIFRLADAMLGRKARRAVHMARSLRAEGEQVPQLLAWICNQLQLMIRLSSALARGQSVDQAFRDERVWSSRYALYRQALQGSDVRFWEARLAQAAQLERVAKGRAAGDPWIGLERLIAAVGEPKAANSLCA